MWNSPIDYNQASAMDEMIPIQILNNKFKIPVRKIMETHRQANVAFYTAATEYGTMTLVVENYGAHILGHDTLAVLRSRNHTMKAHKQCFPAIYEQQVYVNHPQQITCFSLIEYCQPLHLSQCRAAMTVRISNISKLVRSLYLLQLQGLGVEQELNESSLLLYSNCYDIGLDFTKVVRIDSIDRCRHARNLTQCLQILLRDRYCTQQLIKQIIIIKDRIYCFKPELLGQAQDIIQVMMMLNTSDDILVEVEKKPSTYANSDSPPSKLQRVRSLTTRELNGRQKFTIGGTKYDSLEFMDGKCINSLEEISISDLFGKFLTTNAHFRLRRHQHVFIECSQASEATRWQESVLTVHPPVSKIEFIGFVIVYMKSIEPVIHSIVYVPGENSLRIEFTNKMQKPSSLKVIFYESYVIKDEQISMMLERAKIRDCRLDLRYMKVNDTLLMFLANSQKMSKITELYLSDCHGLTDHGINVLLISPFCKSLHSLSLVFEHRLLESSIESISLKTQLKKLHIQKSKTGSLNMETVSPIDISSMKLEELSSMGITVMLNTIDATHIRVLKLDQMISLDDLKFIKALQLTQLKVCLVQQPKKSLIQSTSSFIASALVGKQQNIRAFATGPSNRTLRVLDISSSSVKFKTLRDLLTMPQLEKLTMDHCINLGTQFDSISPKVIQLSLVRCQLNIDYLSSMLAKNHVIVELNLIECAVSKHQLMKYITSSKKFITNLFLSESNYTNKLLEKKTQSPNGFQLVENISLYVDRLLSYEQEHSLCYLLKKVTETSKIITMLTGLDRSDEFKKRALLAKIVKYMNFSGKAAREFKNLFIDGVRFEQLHEIYTDLHTQPSTQPPIESQHQYYRCLSQKCPLALSLGPHETIDSAHRKLSLLPTTTQLSLLMRGNRVIPRQIVALLHQHALHSLTAIDIRDCLFTMDEVIEQLFQFQTLEEINNGQVSIVMNGDTFAQRSQKYLKLFMRVRGVVGLQIRVTAIEEIEILYTVLFHVVDKHSHTLRHLGLYFDKIVINHESELFMDKLTQLPQLQGLEMHITGCAVGKPTTLLQHINKLKKLKQLTLKLPASCFPVLNLRHLQSLSLACSDDDASDQQLGKCMKLLDSCPLMSVSVDAGSCRNVSSMHRLLSTSTTGITLFERIPTLQTIRLNLQYCPLKQQHLLETITSMLKNCPRLRHLEINVSFAIGNVYELISAVQGAVAGLGRSIKVLLIAVTETSSQIAVNQEFNMQYGIELVL